MKAQIKPRIDMYDRDEPVAFYTVLTLPACGGSLTLTGKSHL